MMYINGQAVAPTNTQFINPKIITGYITNGLIYDFLMQKYPTYDEISEQIVGKDIIRTSVNTVGDIVCCENGDNKGGFYLPSLPLCYGLTSFAVSVWFTLDSVSGTQVIFCLGKDAGLQLVSLLVNNGSELNYNAYSNDVKTSAIPNVNEWCNACLVQDETTAKIYINGELKNSKTMNVNISSDHCELATSMGFNQAYTSQGKTTNLLIYNRALTDAEVLQNYNATKGYFGVN